MIARLVLAAVAAGFGLGVAAADDKPTKIPIAPERILTPMPAGWKVAYHAKDSRQEVQEFVPAGETVEDWSEMVTTKIFDGLDRSAKAYNTYTMGRFAALCSDSKKVVGEPEHRSGYVASLAFIECVTSPETRKRNRFVRKVEFLVQLAIKGRDALYVVESAWHTDDLEAPRPTDNADLLNRITSRLDGVVVCDDRIEEKRCRAPTGAAQ